MKKWVLGVLALVAVCTWAPMLDAYQAGQAAQPPVVKPLSAEFKPKAYTVGPGDTIQLDFYGLSESDSEMKKSYLVETAGTIQLKHVGSINISGLTTTEINAAIAKALVDKGFYTAGVVTVVSRVDIERQQRVTVQGSVISAGEKLLRGSQMTVARAILAAGGFAPNAGQEVEVQRTVDGKPAGFTISKLQLDGGDDPQLIEDDVIIVKPGQVFYVNGHVGTPGLKVWKPGMTVHEALALSGGMTAKGRYGHIDRPQKDADGKTIKFIKIGNLKKETEILPDDQLIIKSCWIC